MKSDRNETTCDKLKPFNTEVNFISFVFPDINEYDRRNLTCLTEVHAHH